MLNTSVVAIFATLPEAMVFADNASATKNENQTVNYRFHARLVSPNSTVLEYPVYRYLLPGHPDYQYSAWDY